jgi:2-oxoglutarate/2-oxoacid ferredoxin oxidoreductase subunit beta
MDRESWLRADRMPTSWCPGCGNGTVLRCLIEAFLELGLDPHGVAAVSGIGCSGRTAGYLACDSVHSLHGRAVPVAEGIRMVRDDLKVVVVSGDGDLCGIGGNHLLHATRRNTDMTVILVHNEIYGMTGGQTAPTTPTGIKTITSPRGVWERPFNVQGIVQAHGGFYARSTTWNVKHLQKAIRMALEYPGFAFVDAFSSCTMNYGRRLGFPDANSMLVALKERFRVHDGAETLADDEIGITSGKEAVRADP